MPSLFPPKICLALASILPVHQDIILQLAKLLTINAHSTRTTLALRKIEELGDHTENQIILEIIKKKCPYHCACVVEPCVVVVEIALALVVGLVGQFVELEHEGHVGQAPQLHFGCFRCVSAGNHIIMVLRSCKIIFLSSFSSYKVI